MRRVLFLLLVLVTVASCRGSTDYGECIGIADDGDPHLRYGMSTRNAIVSILLVETVVVPVVWLSTDARCPIARR